MLSNEEKQEIKTLKSECLIKKQPRPDADPVKLARLKSLIEKAKLPKEKPPKKAEPIYAFPTKSRCPRCKQTDTEATSTQGKWQYRRCTRAICRHAYQVEGTKI